MLQVQNLRKVFGDQVAVDNLSFSVKRGSFFAFLGQNGAGKTTTISMLIGLLRPDGGTIQSEAEAIGAVFQENVLDDRLTVRENLDLYNRLTQTDPAKRRARLDDLTAFLGLESFLGKQIRTLSGGQKRKAEIARALLANPDILFLDEPTTGLDPKTRREVWDLLHTLRNQQHLTLFLTTHYMEETADADNVLIIHRGKKAAEGSPAALKTAHTTDTLRITPHDADAFGAQLTSPHQRIADTFLIPVSDPGEAIDRLTNWRDSIRFFEVQKGTMDDVFLQVTGEAMEDML